MEFAECFIKWEDYYDGFFIWSAFKDDLIVDLTESSLRAFFSYLSRKPLLLPGGSIEDSNCLTEVENKLHSWLASDLLPALLSNCPLALVSWKFFLHLRTLTLKNALFIVYLSVLAHLGQMGSRPN